MFRFSLISFISTLILVCAQSEVEEVTFLMLPRNCDMNVSDADDSSHGNFSVNDNIHKKRLYEAINETVISVVPKDGIEIFVLTDTNVLKVIAGQVVDKVTSEKVTSSLAPIFALKTISSQEFLVKCTQTFCEFFNPNNLSDSSTFNLETTIELAPELLHYNSTYNYAPVGQWFKESYGNGGSCGYIHQKYCSVSAGEVHMFSSLEDYKNVIYHFQFNKSSFVVQYANNADGIIIVTEIFENAHESARMTSKYSSGKPVSIYFDWIVSKLYVVVESPTSNELVANGSVLSVGWVDPFNHTYGGRSLCDLVPLPFDNFKEFLVIGGRKIFNLGLEIISIEGNEAHSLVKMSQKINLDKSVIDPGLIQDNNRLQYSKEVIFHTSSDVYQIILPGTSNSMGDGNISTLMIVSVLISGLLIILIGIALIQRKKLMRIIFHRNDIARVESPDGPKGPDAEPTIALPPGFMRQPIFIFEESLSDIEVIAKGAFGNVCKGVYDGRLVAIKSLFKFNAEKLKQEADIACSLDHPNVLPLIGISFDTNNQHLKLVLPFMVNGDLASFLGKFYLRNQVEVTGSLLHSFASQIVAGMAYLVSEDQGHPSIIHRDLAARNCMVDADLTIKVADFGLSRHLDESKQKIKRTLQTSLIPSTSAPESITRLLFNEKTDVWSYGTLLLEFYDCDLKNVPQKVLELSTVCHSVNPDERPTFQQIQLLVNGMSEDDFEPGRDTVSVTTDNVSDEKLKDMIEQAPTSPVDEGANEYRKESLDQEPFDENVSALARSFHTNVDNSGNINGYVNPEIASSSRVIR